MATDELPQTETLPYPKFVVPYSMMLVGPANSGKTTWLLRLLSNLNEMHTEPIDQVFFCYAQWQPAYDEMRVKCQCPIQFFQEVPQNIWELGAAAKQKNLHTLVVLDDLMMSASMALVAALFTRGRHSNLYPVMTVHNLTHRGSGGAKSAADFVTVNRNCAYRVLFCIPSDVNNIRALQLQMFPQTPGFLMAVYQDACCMRQFGYLVLDSHPRSDNNARAYTGVFPGEVTTFYLQPSFHGSELRLPGGNTVHIDYASM